MAQTIAETLTFKTQIHKAWNSSEQRMAMRNYPRRSIAYDYYGMNAAQSQYLRALVYNKSREQIEFPLWHAACSLTKPAYLGHFQVNISPQDLWGFYGCSGILFWKNDILGGDRYYLHSLTALGDIVLTEELEKNYDKVQTTICPVAYGYLKPEDNYSAYTASHTTMQLNVELNVNYPAMPLPMSLNEDNYQYWEFTTPYQKAIVSSYQGIAVFPIAPSWNADIPATFSKNVNELDNGSGIVKYDVKSSDSSETKEIEYVLSSKSEITNFQRFFMRCKGMLKSFYAPTWLNDIVLARDATRGMNYLLTEWPLFWKYYSSTIRRKLIMVFLKNGEVVIITVAGYSVDENGTGKVFLDSPLPITIRMADVVMISFLCRYRFASDSLTMLYDTTGIATTTVSFLEVDA